MNELQQDIDYTRNQVKAKFPLLGKTIDSLPLVTTTDIPTAATDGKKIYINPDYYQSCNNNDKIFSYAHEIMHVAFMHIVRCQNLVPSLWNTATDAVINLMLKGEGLKMPD